MRACCPLNFKRKANLKTCSASTERVLHDFILPLPPSPEEESYYVDRLLLVVHYLDMPGRKALLRASRLYDKRPLVYETYLDICETYNVGLFRSLYVFVRFPNSLLSDLQGGSVEAGVGEDEARRQLQVACQVLAREYAQIL